MLFFFFYWTWLEYSGFLFLFSSDFHICYECFISHPWVSCIWVDKGGKQMTASLKFSTCRLLLGSAVRAGLHVYLLALFLSSPFSLHLVPCAWCKGNALDVVGFLFCSYILWECCFISPIWAPGFVFFFNSYILRNVDYFSYFFSILDIKKSSSFSGWVNLMDDLLRSFSLNRSCTSALEKICFRGVSLQGI